MSEKTTRRQPRQFVEQFRIWLRAGDTDRIPAAATQEGVSMQEFVRLAIRDRILKMGSGGKFPDTPPPTPIGPLPTDEAAAMWIEEARKKTKR